MPAFAWCLALWLGGVFLAPPVLAHAVLTETAPADRTTVAASPPVIVLRFNEAVRPVAVAVLDRAGKSWAGVADAASVDLELRIAVKAVLPQGIYIVSYRVTSADSHPVAGAFLFAVGASPVAWDTAASPQQSGGFWPVLTTVNRAVHLAALLLSTGGILFLLLVGRDVETALALRLQIAAAALLAALTALLAIGFQGGVLSDTHPTQLFGAELWRLGSATTRAQSSLAAIAGTGLATLALWGRPGAVTRAVMAAGIAVALGGFAFSGHAATATPRWIALPALLAHVAVAGFWIGSFAPLLRALRAASPDIAVQRFSRIAVIAVPVLLAAGIVLAAIQVQQLNALTATAYGWILLGKAVLVVGLLALAAYNRLSLTPRLATGGRSAQARLGATIRAELALGLAILAVTALLSQTPPPRSTQMGAGVTATATVAGLTATVTLTPGKPGSNTMVLRLTDGRGVPADPLEVTAELSQPDAGIETITRRLTRLAPGAYRHSGPEFTVPGRWTIRIDALVTDFKKETFELELELQ